jgi:hypothetical protein
VLEPHLECFYQPQGLVHTAANRQVIDCLLAQRAIRGNDEQPTAGDSKQQSAESTLHMPSAVQRRITSDTKQLQELLPLLQHCSSTCHTITPHPQATMAATNQPQPLPAS